MIELFDVHKHFKEPVLRGVSLSVPAKGIYALIGPGAAGKSILFKIIAGLVTPERGSVRVNGEEVVGRREREMMDLRRGIGMLFQNYALFDLSVAENIAFPLRRLFDFSEDEIEARVAERLERVALPGFQDRNPAS